MRRGYICRRVGRAVIGATCVFALLSAQEPFDHSYADYAALLERHVSGARVDYGRLLAQRGQLDDVVRHFDAVDAGTLESWPREEQLAFWINAYNVFTLKAIVDHYPIQGSWFSWYPRSSIRQIDGVWDQLPWRAAGRRVTLDQIEHEILRPTFAEPRIHFAINCASISCPPLWLEPYRADQLDAQLEDAARRYLASPEGLQLDGETLRVTSILDWYGDDFVSSYAELTPGDRPDRDRAILGAVARHGPPAAASLARSGSARLRFLPYNWSLNDVTPATAR